MSIEGKGEGKRKASPRPPVFGPAQLTLLLQSEHSHEILALGENQSALRAAGIHLKHEYEKIAREWFYIARSVLQTCNFLIFVSLYFSL